jgi:hypothetical protein
MSGVGRNETWEPNGWLLTLADGRRFAWCHADGVYSEAEARERLLAQEPSAEIVGVEEERVVMSVYLGEN